MRKLHVLAAQLGELAKMTNTGGKAGDFRWKNQDFADGHLQVDVPFRHLHPVPSQVGCASQNTQGSTKLERERSLPAFRAIRGKVFQDGSLQLSMKVNASDALMNDDNNLDAFASPLHLLSEPMANHHTSS